MWKGVDPSLDRFKTLGSRALVAFLFGLGLTLPVLGALELMAYALPCGALLAGLCAILAAASLNKRTRLIVAIAALAGGLVYLFALGGIDTIQEAIRGMILQFSGVQGALPLVAGPCAMLLTLTFGLLCWLLTSPGVGFYPALAVLLLVLMVLWLTSRTNLLLCTLPALAALVVLLIQANHEQMPLVRILPIAVLLVGLSFLLTPAGGVTSPTLKQTAQNIRQRIFDYFFFTEPRDVFSLANEGYYPQGATQLGGPADPTDHPVMQVRTSRRVLLRGAVMNEYTGRMWRNTTGGRRYLYISPRWSKVRQSLFDMSLPQGRSFASSSMLEESTITVRMLAQNTSNLFLPQRLRSLQVKGDLVPYFNNASEVFVTRDLEAGDTYSATAPLLMAGDAGLGTLLTACENSTDDPNYAAVQETYLQLPSHLQQQVYDLAERIVSGASTPYEKAFALQNYLSRNYRYTLDVAPQDSSMDFVTDFLFNTQEGYCTYFASAMTVLCRMVGLPARYVEGYQAIPDENGLAYVTGLQAHAWTEVYFEGFGWLTFDATPVQSRSGSTPPESDNNDQPDDQPEDQPTPTPEPDTDQPDPQDTPTPTPAPDELPTPTPEPDTPPENEPDPPSLTWLWLLLLLLALALAGVRIYLTLPEQTLKKAKEPTAQFMVWVQAIFDALRICKLPMQAAESPLAYARRIDASKQFHTQMAPLGEALSLMVYGKLVAEPEEIALAHRTYVTLFDHLTLVQKVQLTLMRAFLPLKKRDFTVKGK